MKVWVHGGYAYATVVRMARIAAEVGAQYFSIPYFVGCEKLRFDLSGGCQLEIAGVETLADFKKMAGAGVGRIVTSHGFEIYSEWIKEAENIRFPSEVKPTPQTAVTPTENKPILTGKGENTPSEDKKEGVESNYRSRLEGKELKFL